jgi:uncharacterized protein YciI
MGTYRSTSGQLTIPEDKLASLFTAVEAHRIASGYVWQRGDARRAVADPFSLADLLLEQLGCNVDDWKDDWGDTTSWREGAADNRELIVSFGCSESGSHGDGLGALLATLAAHGVTGTLEHNEDDRDYFRHRLAAGTVHRDGRLDDLYEGDVVLWVGQMKDHDDTAMDVIVHGRTEALAAAALAAEARTRYQALAAAGEVPAELIVNETSDTDVLAVWEKHVAGAPHVVRRVIY